MPEASSRWSVAKSFCMPPNPCPVDDRLFQFRQVAAAGPQRLPVADACPRRSRSVVALHESCHPVQQVIGGIGFCFTPASCPVRTRRRYQHQDGPC